MASIYERTPFFKAQKTWTEKTPLGDVYKLQSNLARNKQKAEIHKDSGQLGIEFTLDKTINDFVRGAEKVDLDYTESFQEFENVLLGRYQTDWKQVLHEHFPEPVDPTAVLPEHDRSLAVNFERAIDLFVIKTLNKSAPRDRQYIYLAPGGDHVFHKELMTTPMDHLHRFQEMLRISEKLPAGNIPVPNAALHVKWLYMSFHKSDRAEFVRSGNKLNSETLQTLTEYFQSIHDVKLSNGSLQQKREDQIRQSTRREMRGELEKRYHDKMSRYTHSRDKRQHANDKRGYGDNSRRVASSTNDRARYDNHRSGRDPRVERKAPTVRRDKDFKPCHLHGPKSEHSFDECRRNPKNASATNKSSYYVKKRGNDAHYNDERRRSSGDESPSERDTPVPSGGEDDDNKSSSDEKSNSNYHIDGTPKKRRFVEKNDVGHKSPTQKKRKTLVEPDSGMKKTPDQYRVSKKDGDFLNFYDTDDVTSDDAKSGLSVTDEKGLSFADFDDAFGFD
jgi:hypothetical protein